MIPKIKRVLYATDLSENSMYAFRYAVNTMEKHDAEMVVLHVIENIPQAMWAYGMLDRDVGDIKEGTIEQLSKRLDDFCREELRERPEYMKRITAVEVRRGYPAEVILRIADDQDCDVIIMGTHGKGLLSYTFLGSVAERVLRRANKPVFIIPLPKE